MVVAVAALAATSTMLAIPAGARVPAKNAEFCQILSSDQGAGIDFDGLGPDEAKFAANLTRKLAKTDVPAKLKRDLVKLAKLYDKIASGAPANTVIAAEQKFVTRVLTAFSKYVSANCIASSPSAS